jgi:3-hydroxyisobutyrate dehydrogenase
VSTSADLDSVLFGPEGLYAGAGKGPGTVVDCSSISLEASAKLREALGKRGVELLAAPVSGNAKVVKAGKLSFVASGPKHTFDAAEPFLTAMGEGASYVGDGELSRIVKICHNVLLGVVIQSLAEITVLAQKAGVPRHAFLDFMNKSVLGSVFSRYKTPALVNLDFAVTFTPHLLRKDLDLGLDAGRKFEVPMPLASVVRDLVQSLIGNGHAEKDFAALLLLEAKAAGIELVPENVAVSDGLS